MPAFMEFPEVDIPAYLQYRGYEDWSNYRDPAPCAGRQHGAWRLEVWIAEPVVVVLTWHGQQAMRWVGSAEQVTEVLELAEDLMHDLGKVA